MFLFFLVLECQMLTSSKSLNFVLAFLIVSMEISWFSWELLSLLSHGIHLKMSTKILVYMQAKFFTTYACSSNSCFSQETLRSCSSANLSLFLSWLSMWLSGHKRFPLLSSCGMHLSCTRLKIHIKSTTFFLPLLLLKHKKCSHLVPCEIASGFAVQSCVVLSVCIGDNWQVFKWNLSMKK